MIYETDVDKLKELIKKLKKVHKKKVRGGAITVSNGLSRAFNLNYDPDFHEIYAKIVKTTDPEKAKDLSKKITISGEEKNILGAQHTDPRYLTRETWQTL